MAAATRMAYGYKQSSPSVDVLGLGILEPTSTFGGSSQDGSDHGFGTPPGGHTIDAMMPGHGAGGAASYHPTSAGRVQNVDGGASDAGVAASPSSLSGHPLPHLHRAVAMGVPDGSSPVLGGYRDRQTMGSGSTYGSVEHANSFSDTISPPSQYGPGRAGDHSLGGSRHHHHDAGNAEEQSGEDGGAPNGAPPPSWSELKTKAGKDRKRLPLACMACRRKKIRCSGEKPSCKHCLRSRIPCVYKVASRKAAPRTDYMAMLDKRLKRMEERVIRIIPKEEQGVVADTGRAVVKPSLPPSLPPKPAGSSAKRDAEQAFGEELDAWAAARVDSSAEKGEARANAHMDKMKTPDAEESNLLVEGADRLPPKDLQEHLAEVFFDYVYGQSYHLLHKPSFMRKLAQGSVPPVLVLAVCAISARFSDHPAVRTEPAFLRGESWASAARDIALKRFDTPNLTILICYLLLGLHEFGTCQGGRSWMFGGMAQRMAYALQLHKDPDHDSALRRATGAKEGDGDLTSTDREIRRRTMWSCFLMDRFNSSGTDRPIFVAESCIRAQLPIKEEYFQMEISGPTEDLEGHVPNPTVQDTGQPTNPKDYMGVAAYSIRLVAIWGRLIRYLNLGGKQQDHHPMWAADSVFQSIKRAVEEWKQALPSSLSYSAENVHMHASKNIANQFIFLHIVYNQIILFMNRFALPIPGVRLVFPAEMPREFTQSCARGAHEAASQISLLIHEAMNHRVVAPFAGYSAFLSSTVHVNGIFSKNAALEAQSKQYLAWNVKYLTKMKKYWGMFHFVTENLRDIYRRHADVARSGAAQGLPAGHGPDGAIFQYGDWFDRYPKGVSGTDYEGPSAGAREEPGADAVLGQKSNLQSVEEFFSKMSSPGRTAQQQQQQQQQSHQANKNTTKKRKASKSGRDVGAASAATGSNNGQAPEVSPVGQPSSQQPGLTNDQQIGLDMTAGLQELHDDMSGMGQRSIALPSGFPQALNPLLMGVPQHPMSALDRQMVLNSYAGFDLSADAQSQGNPLLDQRLLSENLDPFNLDAFSPHNMKTAAHLNDANAGRGSGSWGDPSTAWFMPFNMEPPPGDESNHFSNLNSMDWASLTGNGDMVMPTLSFTPESSSVRVDSGVEQPGHGRIEGTGDGI